MARSKQPASGERSAKRAAGVYYTPAAIVRYIVQRTLGPLLEGPNEAVPPRITVLDPACGAGAFLTEAYRTLLGARSQGRLTFAERRKVLLEQIHGVELDPQAAHQTRLALANLAIPDDGFEASAARGYALESLLAALESNIRQGDALLGSAAFDWSDAFPRVLAKAGGGFDAILMNPPYLNIRRLSKNYDADQKRYLAARYRCARGNYDLYVLFIERAFERLRPGGVCGMITPNKLATLDYAAPCRELLYRETTVHYLADVSSLSIFPDAGVYPHIMVWEKTAPEADHLVRVLRATSIDELAGEPLTVCVTQRDLSKTGCTSGHDALDVESRVATAELGSLVKLHSGATGFVAQQLAGQLVEFADQDGTDSGYEFIVSGNIDRYHIEPGEVRFMKRSFERPVLPKSAVGLTANKHRLYAGAKLVIAGMTKRLEAAFDPGGLALGVQVYAAADWQDDPRYLLALLNSKLLSHLFRTRFRAKELSGGYLAINKGQLERLPIRVIDETSTTDVGLRDKLLRLVDTMHGLVDERRHEFNSAKREQLRLLIAAADERIDRVVSQLYEIKTNEIEKVERESQSPSRNKAAV